MLCVPICACVCVLLYTFSSIFSLSQPKKKGNPLSRTVKPPHHAASNGGLTFCVSPVNISLFVQNRAKCLFRYHYPFFSPHVSSFVFRFPHTLSLFFRSRCFLWYRYQPTSSSSWCHLCFVNVLLHDPLELVLSHSFSLTFCFFRCTRYPYRCLFA